MGFTIDESTNWDKLLTAHSLHFTDAFEFQIFVWAENSSDLAVLQIKYKAISANFSIVSMDDYLAYVASIACNFVLV